MRRTRKRERKPTKSETGREIYMDSGLKRGKRWREDPEESRSRDV